MALPIESCVKIARAGAKYPDEMFAGAHERATEQRARNACWAEKFAAKVCSPDRVTDARADGDMPTGKRRGRAARMASHPEAIPHLQRPARVRHPESSDGEEDDMASFVKADRRPYTILGGGYFVRDIG